MAYFPLFIDLEEQTVTVIGGGKIAARRVKTLIDFGCSILVIAPEICEEMRELIKNPSVFWIQEAYSGTFGTRKPVFVLAAATELVNLQVVEACREQGIPVNDASKKERCDFYFPGIAKEGNMVVGVTAGGSDHKGAAALTAEIREWMKETKGQKTSPV